MQWINSFARSKNAKDADYALNQDAKMQNFFKRFLIITSITLVFFTYNSEKIFAYEKNDIIEATPFLDKIKGENFVKVVYDTKLPVTEKVLGENVIEVAPNVLRFFTDNPYKKQFDGTYTKTEVEILPLKDYETKTKATFFDKLKTRIALAVETFYPSLDGDIQYFSNASWATVHDATTGTGNNYTNTTHTTPVVGYDDTAKYYIYRGFMLFDTSSLADDATIDSAKISLYIQSKSDVDNDTKDYITFVSSNPASNTVLADTDFDAIGTTAYTTNIDIGNITTSAYNDFTLNASGISAISLSSITKFGIREGHDLENEAIVASGSYQSNHIVWRASEYTDTTSDPYLEITLTGSEPPPEATSTATSTANTGDIIFSLGIITFLLCFIFLGFIFNAIIK